MKSNIYCIGNAHLDPAWLWRFEEGFEAFLATCRSALDRMQETPDFIFTCSSAACYEFVEQTDPVLFERIKQAVRSGRWEIIGGWWVEPDCNIPHGEAFVRQALYGQHYFRSRFGKHCTTGYCIDSFGHNVNLPQLLKRAGMDSYIFMRPDAHELALPQDLFRWHSQNGDEVLAYRIPFHYSNFRHRIDEKLSLLESSAKYNAALPWMLFYGVGNHGGGPTKAQIAKIKELGLSMSTAEAFFAAARQVPDLSQVTTELQHHAIGCYSNHSAIKAANRKAEHALMRAEKFAVLSEMLTGQSLDPQVFDQAWKNVLLNQFHDTLGGVATEEVCTEVLESYGEAISVASRNERIALQRIRNGINTAENLESLIVFNAQFQQYKGPIEFELWTPEASERGETIEGITLIDEAGNAVGTQQIEPHAKIGNDRVRFAALCEVPPFGWRTFRIERKAHAKWNERVIVTDKHITNGRIGFGIIHEEPVAPNRISYTPLHVYRDDSDTWAHGVKAFQDKIGEFVAKKFEIVDEGPVKGTVRIISAYKSSTCEQLISIFAESDEVIIQTTLDWREPHAVCKMLLPHGMIDPQFHCEIPYSVLERPVDGNEYPGGSWAFINDDLKGLGVMSDAKSSFSCDGMSLSLIVARSPLYAHHVPPHVQKQHETLRYLDHGVQQFTTKVILGHRNHVEGRMPQRAQSFHEPPVATIESAHGGTLRSTHSAGQASDEVLVGAVKHGHSDARSIVRIVNPGSRKAETQVRLGNAIGNFALSPYEIRSYRSDGSGFREITFIEDEL